MSQRIGAREGAAVVDFALIAAAIIGAALADLNEIWIFAPAVAYFLLRDSWKGQSIGKLIAGVQVVALHDKKPIGLWRSVLRNLAFPIGLGALVLATELMRKVVGDKGAAAGFLGAGMGYIAYYFGAKAADFRTLGDQLAGTIVVPNNVVGTTATLKSILVAVAWLVACNN